MSRLILSGNGSYLKGLYVQWNKLKAVMFMFTSWCTLDIKYQLTIALYKSYISLKLCKGYLVNILNNLKRTMISTLLAGKTYILNRKLIILGPLHGESEALFGFIKNVSILSVLWFLFSLIFVLKGSTLFFIIVLVQIHIQMIMYLI